MILFHSCSAKAKSEPSTDIEKAFSNAGLHLFSQKVSPWDFSLPLALPQNHDDPTEKNLRLSDLKGKVVFLNFWATWCGPCKQEMPSMETLYKRYKERGLEILTVNSMEGKEHVVSYMKDNGFSFPVVLDMDGKAGSNYGIQAIPTSFLIDREGKIISRIVGSIDWDTPKIHAVIEQMLR